MKLVILLVVVISLFVSCSGDCKVWCDNYTGPVCCTSNQTCWTGYQTGVCCDTQTQLFCQGYDGYTLDGGRCYDPSTTRCCPAYISMALCLPSQHCCTDVAGYAACCTTTCAPGYLTCDNACYDPSIFYCTAQHLIPVGLSVCGTAYYSPSIYNCINGFLCPVGTGLCGTNVCYDSSLYTCCSNNQIQPLSIPC